MSETPERRKLQNKPSTREDKIFYGIAKSAGYSTIVLIALILVFLTYRAWPAFMGQGVDNFVTGANWDATLDPPVFGIGPMIYGSLLIAALAVMFAVPMAISIAYFIEFLAPRKVAAVATVIVDLLAAIPSIIIGLWGLGIFSNVGASWAKQISESLSWLIPFLENDSEVYLRSPFIAAIALGTMIVPLISSVTREMFSQVDPEIIKGALALGASRETVLRRIILPISAGGILGGVLLALGRAMGETVAIFYVLNLDYNNFNWLNVLDPYGGNVASLILAKFGEAGTIEVEGLLAAGVVLFVITLIINAIASYIVQKAQPWRRD